jgi:NAD(P)H-nitrite reductase large subunit
MSKRIVIVGAGPVGLVAAKAAREADPEARVELYGDEPYPPHRRPGVVGLISGETQRISDLYLTTATDLRRRRISLRTLTKATRIDFEDRLVHVGLRRGGFDKRPYDSLVLATGGVAYVPRIEGVDKEGVFVPRTLHDALFIRRYSMKSREAAIVGGGLSGIESAEALLKIGLKVTMVVRSRLMRENLDAGLSALLQERLRLNGVSVKIGESPRAIEGGKYAERLVTDSGEISSPLILFATGVRPNIGLIEENLTLGQTGAIQVDEHMQTSAERVFACGDCTEKVEFVMNKPLYMPIGMLGACQATVAGMNAAGKSARLAGLLRAQIDEVFGITVSAIGLTVEQAKSAGIPAEGCFVKVEYRETAPILMKMRSGSKIWVVINSRNGEIIGAQILGGRETGRHASVFRQSILERKTLREMEALGYVSA